MEVKICKLPEENKILKEETERLKEAGNKQDDEVYKLSCDVIVKDKEIERLREESLHLKSIVEDRESMIVQLKQAPKERE